MKTTLPPKAVNAATRDLAEANRVFAVRYPGESGARQPVHSFYGGAHLFRADTAPKLGALALESLDRYAPDPAALAQILSAWSSNVRYADRVTALRAGNGAPQLATSTLIDDAVRDRLFGGNGLDWYLTATPDLVHHLAKGELMN